MQGAILSRIIAAMILSTPIAITGRGMVSSLGNDVRTSCAAARAGLVRPGELDYFQVLSSGDGEDVGVTGYPARLWTLGFEGEGRLLRLLQGALTDLQEQVPSAPWNDGNNGFYLSLPDPRRLDKGLNLVVDEQDRKAKTAKSAEIAEETAQRRGAELFERAVRLSNWRVDCSVRSIRATGHTGITECLADAARDLCSGAIEVAIVGGAETLLEEDTLSWLDKTARLKTPDAPAGLAPGEAGAFLVLETLEAARARKAHIWGILRDLRFADDSRPIFSGEPPLGVGLAEVVLGISGPADWRDGDPVWFITDQNGESYRAMEWGHTLVRLVLRSKAFSRPSLWYPAGAFGDTGAISGAVAACLATSAFERGYAPSGIVGIMSSADGGCRSAALVGMPEKETFK
jgi:3-oxoacyl-[acyl-carrier-protein] synthase-1